MFRLKRVYYERKVANLATFLFWEQISLYPVLMLIKRALNTLYRVGGTAAKH